MSLASQIFFISQIYKKVNGRSVPGKIKILHTLQRVLVLSTLVHPIHSSPFIQHFHVSIYHVLRLPWNCWSKEGLRISAAAEELVLYRVLLDLQNLLF